ncbi:WXG100 family type VII secretion target [Micromonospora sp. LOL_024]|uniref:WXG100 family type VII secretion target n=1 Tax=Micromonospora sp. LOL_024 TaxID=3345412 RepID=UPI003A864989
MTLSVEPAALLSYARQVDRASADSTAIAGYLRTHAQDATGGELIALAADKHRHAVAVISGTLQRLTTVLDTSGPELVAVATYYRQTDLTIAANLDGVLPDTPPCQPLTAVEKELATLVCPPPPFTDVRDATSRLTPPPQPDTPPNALGWMDYLSPTSWAMKGFDIVLGFNPISWLQERMFGNWEALATMQPVLANIGSALHDLALNTQTGASSLRQTWQGQAGDAAHQHFTQLAGAVAELRGPLDKIGHEYKVIADSVWSINEALGGVIKGLIDAAIITGIAAAAGTATAATGVGAVVGYGVAAAEIAYMLKLWGQATQLYQHATAAVLAFRSALTYRLGDLEAVTLPALPGNSGYDHPLVTTGAAR